MESSEEGTWKTKVEKDLIGKFYTFNVKSNDKWLGDTPGINAKAVGVNGKRAAIIDMKSTDPEGWADDKRPALASPADVILYEMHPVSYTLLDVYKRQEIFISFQCGFGRGVSITRIPL